MIVNEAFKAATDYLKKSGHVKNLKDIAETLGIDEKLLGKYRYGQPYLYLEDEITQEFIRKYPETANYFENVNLSEEPPAPDYKIKEGIEKLDQVTITALKTAIAAQEETIRLLKNNINLLREENERLKKLK